MTTTYLPTRGERFAALAVPRWAADPQRARDAADWLRTAMNTGPMSDTDSVSLSWCIRKVSAMRTGILDGSRRTISYSDPVGEYAVNRVVFGGGRR